MAGAAGSAGPLTAVLDAALTAVGTHRTADGRPTLTDSDIVALHALAGPLLPAALDLVDHGDVARFERADGSVMFRIAGTTGTYSAIAGPGRASCSCPAFVRAVIVADDQATVGDTHAADGSASIC